MNPLLPLASFDPALLLQYICQPADRRQTERPLRSKGIHIETAPEAIAPMLRQALAALAASCAWSHLQLALAAGRALRCVSLSSQPSEDNGVFDQLSS